MAASVSPCSGMARSGMTGAAACRFDGQIRVDPAGVPGARASVPELSHSHGPCRSSVRRDVLAEPLGSLSRRTVCSGRREASASVGLPPDATHRPAVTRPRCGHDVRMAGLACARARVVIAEPEDRPCPHRDGAAPGCACRHHRRHRVRRRRAAAAAAPPPAGGGGGPLRPEPRPGAGSCQPSPPGRHRSRHPRRAAGRRSGLPGAAARCHGGAGTGAGRGGADRDRPGLRLPAARTRPTIRAGTSWITRRRSCWRPPSTACRSCIVRSLPRYGTGRPAWWAPPAATPRPRSSRWRRWPGPGSIADLVVDAKSGVSGAGKEPRPELTFSEVNESVKAYGVGGHRHVAEMEQELGLLSPSPDANPGVGAIDFLPHLIPMTRGILSAGHVRPTRPIDQAELDDLYAAAYADEPFVQVVDAPPATGHVLGSNSRAHPRHGRPADRAGPGHRRHRQPGQGRRRPGHPGVQRGLRAARDRRPGAAAARPLTSRPASTRPQPTAALRGDHRSTRAMSDPGIPSTPDLLAPLPSPLPPVERAARLPLGFRAGAATAGIKASGKPDLSVLASAHGPLSVAATFTTNRFPSAPVILSQAHLAATAPEGGRRLRHRHGAAVHERLRERRHRGPRPRGPARPGARARRRAGHGARARRSRSRPGMIGPAPAGRPGRARHRAARRGWPARGRRGVRRGLGGAAHHGLAWPRPRPSGWSCRRPTAGR